MRYELTNALPRPVTVKLLQDGLVGRFAHQGREPEEHAPQRRDGRVGGDGAGQRQGRPHGQLRNAILGSMRAASMRCGCAMWLIPACGLCCAVRLASTPAAAADVLAETPSDLAVTVYRAPERESGSIDLDDCKRIRADH